jgi:hypothetical protein
MQLKNIIPKLGIILLLILLGSCKEDINVIPDVHVDFTIYLNDPLYRELRTIGNSITVTGGHAGIVIYHFQQNEFLAFDRLCPVEQKTSCRLQETNDDLFYTCECCNTPYLMVDGTGQSKSDNIFAGTGQYLKEYRTYYDNVNQLRITNF